MSFAEISHLINFKRYKWCLLWYAAEYIRIVCVIIVSYAQVKLRIKQSALVEGKSFTSYKMNET